RLACLVDPIATVLAPQKDGRAHVVVPLESVSSPAPSEHAASKGCVEHDDAAAGAANLAGNCAGCRAMMAALGPARMHRASTLSGSLPLREPGRGTSNRRTPYSRRSAET